MGKLRYATSINAAALEGGGHRAFARRRGRGCEHFHPPLSGASRWMIPLPKPSKTICRQEQLHRPTSPANGNLVCGQALTAAHRNQAAGEGRVQGPGLSYQGGVLQIQANLRHRLSCGVLFHRSGAQLNVKGGGISIKRVIGQFAGFVFVQVQPQPGSETSIQGVAG